MGQTNGRIALFQNILYSGGIKRQLNNLVYKRAWTTLADNRNIKQSATLYK